MHKNSGFPLVCTRKSQKARFRLLDAAPGLIKRKTEIISETSALGQDNRHIVSLDGLRGFAALAVLVAHAGSEGFLTLNHTQGLGKIGVALFYTLSGFLMGHLYLDRPWTGQERRNYMVARFARILPLFYVAVFFEAVLLFATGFSVYGFQTLVHIALNLGFIRGNGVLWSVPVEVQFYLLFLLLWGAASRGYFWVAMLGLLTVQITGLLILGGGEETSNALIYWLHYFLLGLLLSRIYRATSPRLERWCRHDATGWISVPMLLLCLALMPGLRLALGWPFLPIYADPFVLVAVFIFAMMSFLGRGPFRIFATPVMGWLGARSFGIYLFHVPVLLIVAEWLPAEWKAEGIGFMLVLVASFSVADLLHRSIERPAGRLFRRRLLHPTSPPLQPEAVLRQGDHG